MKPQIVMQDYGKHNANMEESIKRLEYQGAYKDLSTIILVPGFGSMPTKCVAAWMNMFTPPNGKVHRIWALGMEVGEAFSQTIEMILATEGLKDFKYLLTLEHDNTPPPDGLVKLLARMEANPQYDCIGGLYYTKGEGGVPQIWGDRKDPIPNFRPQIPVPGQLVECWGTGMGFNLFRLSMFKDEKLRKPWFKTIADAQQGVGTQDLYFWGDAQKHGHRCAIDCDVLVGHYDLEGKFGPPDMTW